MATPGPTPDIYSYLDHRSYLRDWFASRKATNPRFSHRLFARLAGQSSPSLLLHIIEGKRNLTANALPGFLRVLQLDAEAAAFFAALVELGQASTDQERNVAWERISAARRFRQARRIEGGGFAFLSRWSYPAIRELVASPAFQEDPRWIARQLRPRISPAEAAQALSALLDMGMLERDEQGRLRQAGGSVVTPTEVVGLAVHNYHRGVTDLAAESIEGALPTERHLLGVTVGIPLDLVPQLKEELNRFQARLLDLCDGAGGPVERVYQLNLQLFPLSEPLEPA